MADRLTPASAASLTDLPDADIAAALRHMAEVLTARMGLPRGLGPSPLAADQAAAWARLAEDASAFSASPRHALTSRFDVWQVEDAARPEGLFTGYYEAELRGSLAQSAAYPFPVHAKPVDLVTFDPPEAARAGSAIGKWINGAATPYDTRQDIETGSLDGRADILCFVSSRVDLFFMQVQGSGRVVLESGEVLRLGYAAKSGRPYQSIGAVLVREGLMTRAEASMQSIRRWLAENPARNDWLLWHNTSYVFFRKLDLPDPSRGAIGAAGVQLLPFLSLAIDKTRYPYGAPVLVETTLPDGQPFRRLMIAADTGSAILGAARGDIYCGWGAEAEERAGRMKQPGRMHVFLPKRA